MEETSFNQRSILLIGNGKLACSVYMCISNAGHKVHFFAEDHNAASERIQLHLTDMNSREKKEINCSDLKDILLPGDKVVYDYILIVTDENPEKKKTSLQIAEKFASDETVITINTESIGLGTLQRYAKCPQRIIGVNWAEPAHTTYFLEIITNNNNPDEVAADFCNFAKHTLHKDPYVVKKDFGIRTRMLCAMIREAFYLVENGFVTVEDIDRACRNDAGYYLPFAGNFRYMDLMGTFIYGIVMKDLNPELSKDISIPTFFKSIIENGGEGMKNGHGFYEYHNGDSKKWDEIFRTYSYQIQKIIEKYSVIEKEENIPARDLVNSVHE
jgi:3-hydroxybutyryl-CoA dehydrogenase